jgi:hypothetical protein
MQHTVALGVPPPPPKAYCQYSYGQSQHQGRNMQYIDRCVGFGKFANTHRMYDRMPTGM